MPGDVGAVTRPHPSGSGDLLSGLFGFSDLRSYAAWPIGRWSVGERSAPCRRQREVVAFDA